LTIRDFQGTFFADAGVMSGQNGRYALGLNIEQGLRSSQTTVVADIAARDALYPLVGDQAYVIDDANGEWALFMWNGSGWDRFQNQRSESTDAKTIEAVHTFPNSGDIQIGAITAGRRLLKISVVVLSDLTTPPNFEVEVGATGLWNYEQNGGAGVGAYSVETDYITSLIEAVTLKVPANAATGSVRVEVTYL
jgi:hypothetical protein